MTIKTRATTLDQLQRERDMLTNGHDRFMERQEKLKDLSIDRSHSQILKQSIVAVAKALDERLAAAAAPVNHRPFSWINDLTPIDTETLAYLGLVCCMESVGLAATRTACLRTIGSRIEMEHFAVGLREFDKKLSDRVVGIAVRNSSSEHRKKAVRSIAAKEGYAPEKWSQERRLKAAAPVLSAILEASNVFDVWTQIKNNKTIYRMGLTDEASEAISDLNADISWNEPVFTPMVTEPRAWLDENSGCYLDPALAAMTPLVRHASKKQINMMRSAIRSGRMSPALSAINKIQQTRYVTNEYVLEAVKWAWQNDKQPNDSFPKGTKIPQVEFPENYEELGAEEKKGLRLDRSSIRLLNKQVDTDRTMIQMDIKQAEDLLKYEGFYIPMSFDFRGRIYPIPAFNMHRADHIKAMFVLADKRPVGNRGAYWIAVQVANTGDFSKMSKASFSDRLNWVLENADRIAEIGNDFEGTYDDGHEICWSKADKPFAFLAACREFYGFWIHGTDYCSGLPINLDGSNSGIQHFSAASLTESDAALVNLVPSEKPADIYQAVADLVIEMLKEKPEDLECREWIEFGISRNIVKRNVMTFGYSSSVYGFTDQLMEDLMTPLKKEVTRRQRDEHPFSNPPLAARKLAELNWQAINRIIVGASEGMAYFQGLARILATNNHTMSWFTPVGFPVDNSYFKNKSKRLRLYLYDKECDSQLETFPRLNFPDERTVDTRKCASSISPNVIHSWDSSHLMSTVLVGGTRGIKSWMLIHDSFATTPAQTDILFKTVRETFVEQYDNGCLYDDITQQLLDHHPLPKNVKLPIKPAKGSLDLKLVLQSDYCFA